METLPGSPSLERQMQFIHHTALGDLIMKVFRCGTSEGCDNSFVLSRPKGKAEWVQVTVRPEGQRAYQLYSGSYELSNEPVRVSVNVCLPAGTIIEFFYQSEREGMVALPGIPRF